MEREVTSGANESVMQSCVYVGVTSAEKVTATYPISLGKPASSQHKGERCQVGLQEQDVHRLLATLTKTMDLRQDSLLGTGDW